MNASQYKVALVTGAATGIGQATAMLLAERGLKVAVCDINAAAGQALADEIGGTFIECDVADLASVEQALAQCETALGPPDLAHLNAGIMTVPTGGDFLGIEDVAPEQYKRIVGVNLDGVYHGLKTLLPGIRERGGAICITASIAAFGNLPVDPMYSATKHALVGFARSVAVANQDRGVRINVICPGVVDTAIVPDAFRDPATIMPPAELAAEVVDLLYNGSNGEVRAKVTGRPAFTVPPIDVNALP
ncbi:MAG: SDR family oxidoreductase [Pseudomonadota bacterium]